MKIFKIPVEWESYGVIEIEAVDLQQAIKMVENDDIPLPDNEEYIDGSFKINDNFNFIKSLNGIYN